MFRLIALAVPFLVLLMVGCQEAKENLSPIEIPQANAGSVEATPTPTFTSPTDATSVPSVTSTVTPRVSVMENTDATKTLCAAIWRPGKYDVVFVNQKVCIFHGLGELLGQTHVYLVNPSPAETISWTEDAGLWLKDQKLDACGAYFSYDSATDQPKPIQKPSFCQAK